MSDIQYIPDFGKARVGARARARGLGLGQGYPMSEIYQMSDIYIGRPI